MEKNEHISDQELDNLLSRAFLDLDFEETKNKKLMAFVSEEVMEKPAFSFFSRKWLNLLFLLLSFTVCLTSFYRHSETFVTFKNETSSLTPKMTTSKNAVTKNKIQIEKKVATVELENTKTFTKPLLKINQTIQKSRHINNSRFIKQNEQTKPAPKAIQSISISDSIANRKDSLNAAIETKFKGNFNNAVDHSIGVDSLPASTRQKIPVARNAAKKIQPVKTNNKVKIAKRRKGNFFSRMKKLRKKGSRFLKDSRKSS